MPYINHLAVPVDDVDRATAFYEDWFDAQVVPSPEFSVPVSWVLLGKVQVHLVTRPGQASEGYHFSLAIEDRERFEALYWRADREGTFDSETFHHHLFQTADGVVQLYLKDPSGNIVECDYAGGDGLDPRIVAIVKHWSSDDERPRSANDRSPHPSEAIEQRDVVTDRGPDR